METCNFDTYADRYQVALDALRAAYAALDMAFWAVPSHWGMDDMIGEMMKHCRGAKDYLTSEIDSEELSAECAESGSGDEARVMGDVEDIRSLMLDYSED